MSSKQFKTFISESVNVRDRMKLGKDLEAIRKFARRVVEERDAKQAEMGYNVEVHRAFKEVDKSLEELYENLDYLMDEASK